MLYRVLKQAQQTFNKENKDLLLHNIPILKKLIDDLKWSDLAIPLNLISKKAFSIPNKAPCTFVSILETENITASVFILKENYTMPLHDHKEMTGFLKIIAGTVKIQSYTRTNPTDSNPNQIEVREDPEKIVDTNTESSMLTPSESNYHEITAIQGPAAFFDILTPPYETEFFDASKNSMEKRVCNFYRKIQNPDNTLYLEKIPTPRHYWCDSFYYPQDYLKSDYSC